MSTFPATNSNEAVELIIDGGNQLHQIINEDATTEVQTESGPIPSVRKALADTFLFLEPIPWQDGSDEISFNQLRTFDGDIYWAPTATLSTPIPMGATPIGDSNWKLAPVNPRGYRGLWPDTGGSALKDETWQTQINGVPTGDYYTALQNTNVGPVGDNVNWKANNDYGSVDSDGLVVKHRRGTQSEIDTFTGAIGEIVVNTTEDELVLNNGVEQGGIPVPRKDTTMLSFTTLATAMSNTALKEGYSVSLEEHTTDKGGNAVWDVVFTSSVTPNGYNIVQCTGIPTLALVLREDVKISLKSHGVADDGTDQYTKLTEITPLVDKPLNGERKTFDITGDVDTLDAANFDDTVLRKNKVKDFTQGFLDEIAAKISNGHMYTAWAQDSAYVLNNQIRVWVTQKNSHTDANGTPVCLYSDDNGASFNVYMIDEQLNTHSVWSAGIANGREYVIIRDDSVAPNYTFRLYNRDIPTGGTAKYFDNWSSSPITLPTPPFGTNTVMIHSFTEGHDNSIVVGAHNGDGAWLLRSTDQGASWTATTLLAGTNQEEPTVKFHNGQYYGFIRAGDTGNNPKFWHSNGSDLNDITVFTAPSGTFGVNALEDCPIPLVIDDGGIIHAFAAYRNGTLEGRSTDEDASMFYIKGVAESGNFWEDAEIYRLGVAHHAEVGGASAIGVGSVLIHNNNVQIYGGDEGRTGDSTSRDRVTEIMQWTIPLKKGFGAYDYRQRIARNAVAPYQFHKINGENEYGHRARYMLQQREKLSSAYSNVDQGTVAYNIDSDISSSGFAISNDANYGYYYAYGSDANPRGIRIETGSGEGSISLLANGSEVIRLWDAVNNRFRPSSDADVDCGAPLQRWDTIYASTSAINTSDKNQKTDFEELPEEFIDVLCNIANKIQSWKWIKAVEDKGEGARKHIGPIAQEVYEEFQKIGVDAFEYSFLCRDLAVKDEDVEVELPNGETELVSKEVPVYNEDGTRTEIWGLRHDVLQYAILWAQQQKINQLLGG